MLHQLKKKILISGRIELLTGLRIGGSSSAMSIGGLDNIIIRNPLDNKPYIPGSSLKGKMRAMIELRDGKIGDKPMSETIQHPPCNCGKKECTSCMLFGFTKKKTGENDGSKHLPSRIIVRDGRILFISEDEEEKFIKKTDVPYAEVKTEVVIDRIISSAMPRQMERVPAGAEFSLELVINIFKEHSEEDEKKLVQTTYDALMLLQDDYLGGSGSRGYGQVKFHIESVKERPMEFYSSKNGKESDYTLVSIPNSLLPLNVSK
jgi:CRISPR-associated protein Csm3